MDQKFGLGVLGAQVGDVERADAGVDVALAVPHVHRPADLLLDVGAEEHVRPEEDLRIGAVLAVDVLDHAHRVRRGHAVVRLRLDLGRRVDVHDHDCAGVVGLPGPQLVRGDRVGQRAAGVEVGQQDGLLRGEDRSGLSHEVNPAEGDDLLAAGGRLAREPERVAHVVGDLLDLGQLVVVREDHGVALAGKRADLVLELGDRIEGQEGGLHQRGSTRSDRSRAGAECVSAPSDIQCTPVRA